MRSVAIVRRLSCPAKPAALDAHDAVADAIAKGEPERARTAMLDIVDEVARALKFF